MIEPRTFGYQGLFGSRDTLKDAMNFFSSIIINIPDGPSKIEMLTGAFVLSNTLAELTSNLANALEANTRKDPALIDGQRLAEITVEQFLAKYQFSFEPKAMMATLQNLDKNATLATVFQSMEPLAKTYLLMATPKAENKDGSAV